jgi:SAM-dependent methyltransferase
MGRRRLLKRCVFIHLRGASRQAPLNGRDTFSRVLDVGARDVNGSVRDFCPPNADYIGVDLDAGPGVDHVLDDPTKLPFDDDTFDVVMSTSCFEHDQMFWLTFAEMRRVLKPSGYIYINAPSNGAYNSYRMTIGGSIPMQGSR